MLPSIMRSLQIEMQTYKSSIISSEIEEFVSGLLIRLLQFGILSSEEEKYWRGEILK